MTIDDAEFLIGRQVALAKHKPRRLYDRDKIQIGRIKFRLAMADEQTGDVINPIAEALAMPGSDFGQSSDGNSVTRTFKPNSSPHVLLDANHDSVDGEIESVFGSTIELQKPDSKEVSAAASEELADEEKPGTPRKLPSHLRPKGPANSQNAAEQALRNMFNRRG